MPSRIVRYALTALLATSLTACSAISSSGIGAHGPPLFMDAGVFMVKRAYIDRYRCAVHEPMFCECASRLSQECRCSCSVAPSFR